MRLRPATLEDVKILEAWDREPHVIEAGGAWESFDWTTEIPRDLPWRELLIAELYGRPIGMVQLIDPTGEESRYWGDISPGHRAIDIWIGEPECLGQGYGTTTMRLALERCFRHTDVRAIVIDPLATNTRAIRFYERLGFMKIGRRFFGEDDCMVLRLHREAWERAVEDWPTR